MALSLTSEHELSAQESGAGRFDPLVLSYAVLFAFLILIGLLVTLFGEPLDNTAIVRLDLTRPALSFDKAVTRS